MVEDVKVRTLLEALTENFDIIVGTAAMLSVIYLVRHARSLKNASFTAQHREFTVISKNFLKIDFTRSFYVTSILQKGSSGTG